MAFFFKNIQKKMYHTPIRSSIVRHHVLRHHVLRHLSSSSTHIPTSKLPSRETQVGRLSSGKEIFDVLVIGGGATGSGTALDAATRGLSVGLIERGDFGSETSSRSTKLIWAGIRYIATATSQLLRFQNLTNPVGAMQDFWSEFKMVLGTFFFSFFSFFFSFV